MWCREQLELLEHRDCRQEIDLYFGNETQISEEGYVPYGWQFKAKNISIKSQKGKHINCFGLLTRGNKFIYETTTENINSAFVIEQLDKLSWNKKKHCNSIR